MRSFPLNDDEEWFYTRMRLLTKEQQEVIYMLVRQYSAGTSPPLPKNLLRLVRHTDRSQEQQ